MSSKKLLTKSMEYELPICLASTQMLFIIPASSLGKEGFLLGQYLTEIFKNGIIFMLPFSVQFSL